MLSDGSVVDVDFALGGGILNLFRIVLSIVEDKKIILVDEPEAFLHPIAQTKLLEIFLESSKDRQIVITMHSPFMFKGAISSKAKLFIFKKEIEEIQVRNARETGWGLFPWSPSWGEINYYAYGLPTIEFHDELYGYLHQTFIDGSSDREEARKRGFIDEFDLYLKGQTTQKREWIPEKGWEKEAGAQDVSLQTFIRNKVHHPENSLMRGKQYSEEELRISIVEMTVLAGRVEHSG